MKHLWQNKIWITFFTLMFVISLTGCVSTGKKKTSVTIKQVNSEQVQPGINQAILITRASQAGDFRSLPFVNINANTKIKIDKKSQIDVYSERPLSILQYNIDPAGIASLVLLSESTGMYGEIDRRLEKIVYKTSKPDAVQVKNIKTWILEQNRISKTKASDSTKNILMDFQKEKGLNPDGQLDEMTANALAQDFSMININSLESSMFYPETPNHMVFLLPYETFKNESSKLSKGFKSWAEISKLGITKEKFKKTAKKGQQYILFVYFFDRVDPAYGINVAFATNKNARSGTDAGKPFQAKPGVWPIVTKVFTIDKVPDKLYVNIFLQKSVLSSTSVGSHQLL